MQKEKKVFVYHPSITGVSIPVDFGVVLGQLCSSRGGVFVVDRDDHNDNKIILRILRDAHNYVISVQKLKEEDLPKVASVNDGSNEVNLTMPEGTALSFKNLFIYNCDKGILVAAKLGSCPQIRNFRECLQKIVRDEISGFEHAILVTAMVFERGLTEKLNNAESITMAQFRSDDFYGEEVDGTRLEQYKDYLSGQGYTRTTKLSGIRGGNLKTKLMPIIEDIVSNGGELPEHMKIKMKIDGDEVDFGKYYKMYRVMVGVSESNHKYLDYDDLKLKLLGVIEEFET